MAVGISVDRGRKIGDLERGPGRHRPLGAWALMVDFGEEKRSAPGGGRGAFEAQIGYGMAMKALGIAGGKTSKGSDSAPAL